MHVITHHNMFPLTVDHSETHKLPALLANTCSII